MQTKIMENNLCLFPENKTFCRISFPFGISLSLLGWWLSQYEWEIMISRGHFLAVDQTDGGGGFGSKQHACICMYYAAAPANCLEIIILSFLKLLTRV